MINANELRIGNWVNFNNIPHQIDGGDIYDLESGPNVRDNADPDRWLPTPLTPEILEKCGFVKETGDSAAWIKHGTILIKSTDYDDGRLIVVGLSYWVGEEQHCCYVHNLHQLQNLYFALTGTEL